MGKIKVLWRRGVNGAKMRHPLPGLGFEMDPQTPSDRLSMISPDFEGNTGQPTCIQNGPVLSANHGRGLPKLCAKLRPSGGGLEMMHKMGHS